MNKRKEIDLAENYLSYISMKPHREGVTKLYELCLHFCPDLTLQDIFITERKEGASVGAEDLWFFSPRYLVRVPKFLLKKVSFEVIAIEGQIGRFSVERLLSGPGLSLEFNTILGASGTLNAESSGNCEYLVKLARDYFKPNLAGTSSS